MRQKKATTTPSQDVSQIQTDISQAERLATLDCPFEKLRGYGIAESKTKDFARQQAILRARNDLSSVIQTRVQSYMEMYNADVAKNDLAVNESSAQSIITQTISQTLTGTKVLFADFTEKNGMYTYEVCVELDEEKIRETVLDEGKKNSVLIDADIFKASAEAAWAKIKVK